VYPMVIRIRISLRI